MRRQIRTVKKSFIETIYIILFSLFPPSIFSFIVRLPVSTTVSRFIYWGVLPQGTNIPIEFIAIYTMITTLVGIMVTNSTTALELASGEYRALASIRLILEVSKWLSWVVVQ